MNIAIIEDDKNIAKLIANKLNNNWYKSRIFNSKKEFESIFNKVYDLYIIDISLWDWNWLEIIETLRKQNISSPIIITSSYNDTQRKVYWLDIWADDYLAKPFAPEELLARIRTIIRRNSKCSNSSTIKYNDIEYCLVTKELTQDWNKVDLTTKELLMLELFLLNKNKIIDKSKLINYIWWNIDILSISDNNINVILSKLRKKLWKDFNLKTIVNIWYILK